MKKFIILSIMLIQSLSFLLFATGKHSTYYQRSLELQNQAKAAFDYGDYDKGYQQTLEAKKYSELAISEIKIIKLQYWVWARRGVASEDIVLAKGSGAINFESTLKLYGQATNLFELGLSLLSVSTNTELDTTNFLTISNNLFQSGETFIEASIIAKQATINAKEYFAKSLELQQKTELFNHLKELRKRYALLIENGVLSKNDSLADKILKHINTAENLLNANDLNVAKTEAGLAQKSMDDAVLRNEAKSSYLFAFQEHQKASKKFESKKSVQKKLNDAGSEILKSKESLDKGLYASSIKFSKNAIDVLQKIDKTLELPKHYTVRILSKADCLWRIAGYYFIYDNPHKWPVLYRANKSRLVNPDNPHLILPGQVFVIPDLNEGEKRSKTDSKN